MAKKKSEYVKKSHNVSVLLYHLVSSVKYRKSVFTTPISKVLVSICEEEIENKYEIRFLEIGTDDNHVHWLIQSVPTYSPKQIAQTVKSITARGLFKQCGEELKEVLYGGEFWGKGYFINSVSKHGNELIISNYVKGQGKGEYKQLKRVG